MVKRCAIKGCKSESYVGCGISFFKLPDDEVIKEQWFEIIGSSVTNQFVICSRHFKPEDIIIQSNSKAKLRISAVPSIFPECPDMESIEELLPVTVISKSYEQHKPLLKTMINNCKREAKYKNIHIPLEEYESRVSFYTGVPQEVIHEMSNEIQRTDIEPKIILLNLTQRILILDTLRKFYEQGETPKYKDVYQILKNYINFPDLNLQKFTEQMVAMGFHYKELVNGKMLLMEHPKITFERCLFLNKIKKIRSSSSQIYYIDERIMTKELGTIQNKELSFKKPWLQNVDKNLIEAGNTFIFFHVVSQHNDTYVAEGLFCNQGYESVFQKWVVDVLLKDIKPSSTIVMDKSPMHGVLKDQTISRYHPKEDMLKWLKNNDIPCTANMNKAQLYELIRKCSTTDKEFTIDHILRAHGHNVLRLPTNFHDLSPTEFLWNYISTCHLPYTEETEWEIIQTKIFTHFKNIPADTWIEFVKKTELFEDNLQHIDTQIEKSIEKYVFKLP